MEAKKNNEPPAFIAAVETWGSGGHMLDVLTLHDGSVLLITRESIVLYESREAFDAGTGGRAIARRIGE